MNDMAIQRELFLLCDGMRTKDDNSYTAAAQQPKQKSGVTVIFTHH
jgi:hypothetical protein